MGSILLLVCVVRSGLLVNGRNRALVDCLESRAAVSAAIESGLISGKRVVTDRPGWLAYAHRARMVDLTGEFSPEVLACLDDKGGLDASELCAYLAGAGVDSMVIWTPEREEISLLIPCEPIPVDASSRRPEWPKICAVSRSGAF